MKIIVDRITHENLIINFGNYLDYWNSHHLLLFESPEDELIREWVDLWRCFSGVGDLDVTIPAIIRAMIEFEEHREHIYANSSSKWRLESTPVIVLTETGLRYPLNDRNTIILIDSSQNGRHLLCSGTKFHNMIFLA